MKSNHVEYHISGSLQSTWRIFRQDAQIGARRSILDAIDFATHIAEREAASSCASTRVTIATSLREIKAFRATGAAE